MPCTQNETAAEEFGQAIPSVRLASRQRAGRARAVRVLAVEPPFEREGDFVAGCEAMLEVLRRTREAATHSAPVLITGETGTGKDCIARMLHRLGPRSRRAFVPVNCGALQANLTAAEFLGHCQGAFTGATRAREGLFRAANFGSLFLDELGDLNAEGQATLLRVLDDGQVRAVGATRTERVDVRVVAASNKDLEREVREGRFREDLLYRLRQVRIELPPVRARGADVAALVEHWFERLCCANPAISRIDAAAMAVLQSYSWPGNVREIRAALEHALVGARGPGITVTDLPSELRAPAPRGAESTRGDGPRAELLRVLEAAHGDRQQAAKLLGVSRATFYRRMNEYGLTRRGTRRDRIRAQGQ